MSTPRSQTPHAYGSELPNDKFKIVGKRIDDHTIRGIFIVSEGL